MVSESEGYLLAKGTFKFEHSAPKNVPQLLKSAVSLELLKPFELKLRTKRLVPISFESNFAPLWFLAETERNIFLWRKGFSLIQAEDFDFWVDLQLLISKRLRQLENKDDQNPFLNPLWGVSYDNKEFAQREISYLQEFANLLEKSELHLHALSQVKQMIHQELQLDVDDRQQVLLPGTTR